MFARGCWISWILASPAMLRVSGSNPDIGLHVRKGLRDLGVALPGKVAMPNVQVAGFRLR